MTKFAKQHRLDLEAIPSAFISVNLTAATAEIPKATADERAKAAALVENFLKVFYEKTGWHPKYVKAVAGAVPYTKYNPLVRFVMKCIVRNNGGDTDTSRDFVYTNWPALDQFVEEFASAVQLTHVPCPTSSSAPA
jgi:menaquinone-dependent protoporphyrinogen oxidase